MNNRQGKAREDKGRDISVSKVLEKRHTIPYTWKRGDARGVGTQRKEINGKNKTKQNIRESRSRAKGSPYRYHTLYGCASSSSFIVRCRRMSIRHSS